MKKKLIVLSNNLQIYFSYINNLFFIKGVMGVLVLKMPSLFFYINKENFLSFVFLNRFFFISFFKHFSYLYKRLYFFNFVRLKIRGLGYRISKISSSFFRFFFGHTNFFYLHAPKDIIIKSRKRRLLLLSNNLFALKLVLAHLLLLKKLSVYRIRGLVYPRQVIVLKIGKKNL